MRLARREARLLDLAVIPPQAPAPAPVVVLRAVSITSMLLSRTYADIVAEFAHGKVDPVEAGKKGGQTSS
jgi:hypothetical protein